MSQLENLEAGNRHDLCAGLPPVAPVDRLVTTRRDGQTIFYSISSDHARRIIELLYEIYCPQP
jgi:hypothetical protein